MARPKGTPKKLTPEVSLNICKMLEVAVPEKYAAEANGIAEETFHFWMRQGGEGVRKYAEFFAAVTRARARAVSNMHVKALGGEKGSSAALWLLERRFHHEYGPRQRIEHTSTDPLAAMTDAELEAELEAQRRRVAAFDRIKRAENPAEQT
jgi:hypothetical protein